MNEFVIVLSIAISFFLPLTTIRRLQVCINSRTATRIVKGSLIMQTETEKETESERANTLVLCV